jgi:triosephosphate isomerase
MLKSLGVDYVILGHSERREYFKESNELLAAKVQVALDQNLIPIFCCGEPLSVRESDQQEAFVNNQLTESLFQLPVERFSKLVIAYEPIWAIGTGRTASAEQAQQMHASIRQHIAGQYGEEVAGKISILYGGSCKPSNAREIFAGEDVDGGLIGGASLNAGDFMAIANSL